jgi:hypothetical protein
MGWLGRILWQRVHDPRLVRIDHEVEALKLDMKKLKEQTAELVASNERPKT